MKKYIVYMTINLVNNKFYIGVHGTNFPDQFDGYYGCGVSLIKNYFMKHPRTYFQKALKKYGFKNFKRITLACFDNPEDAYELEATIVTENFLKRPDTYNLALSGGRGAIYYRPVYQFSLTGKLIEIWDNNSAAAEAMGVHQPSICRAVKTKGSCAGYYWSNTETIDITQYTNHIGKEVFQYDENGIYQVSYTSLTKAASAVNETEKVLFRAITQQIKRNGCYWSFSKTDKFIPKRPSLKNKSLYIYTLEGMFIKELLPTEIKSFFNTANYGNLKSALINGTPYKGVQVSLEKREKLTPIQEFTLNKSKQIQCFDSEGNLVETFSSIKQATKKFGTKVVRVIRQQKASLNGYTFKVL